MKKRNLVGFDKRYLAWAYVGVLILTLIGIASATSNISSNFTLPIENIRGDFYGVNTHGNYLSGDELTYGVKLDTDDNGTTDNYANITEYRSVFNSANLNMSRGDARIKDIYQVIPNKGAEYWDNTSTTGARGSYFFNVPIRHTISTDGGNGVPHASRSLDAHSGNYSVNITNMNTTATGNVYDDIGINANLPMNNIYNFSVWIKSSDNITINVQRKDTYANLCSDTSNGTNDWKLLSCSFNYTTYIPNGLRFTMTANKGESFLWDDMSSKMNDVEFDFFVKDHSLLTEQAEHLRYLSSIGKEYLDIVDFTPSELANYSSLCSSSVGTCMPYDYTILDNILDFHFRNITNNGQFSKSLLVEIKNEPDLTSFFMSGMTSGDMLSRLGYYLELYNHSYTTIKNVSLNIRVGGIALGAVDTANRKNSYVEFLKNASFDFLSIHDYDHFYDGAFNNGVYFNWLFNNCSILSKNCGHLIFSEFNIRNSTIQNSSSLSIEYSSRIGLYYLYALNNYPANISFTMYQLAEEFRYNNSDNYPEYPQKWAMFSGKQLDNEYMSNFNATYNFAHLCPAGGTVYQSSSDDDTLKVVSCKDGTKYNTIIINTDTESKNVSLDMNGVLSSIDNYETGDVYTTDSLGVIQLGIMDSYDIMYLSSEVPAAPINNPTTNDNLAPIVTYHIPESPQVENNKTLAGNFENYINNLVDSVGDKLNDISPIEKKWSGWTWIALIAGFLMVIGIIILSLTRWN